MTCGRKARSLPRKPCPHSGVVRKTGKQAKARRRGRAFCHPQEDHRKASQGVQPLGSVRQTGFFLIPSSMKARPHPHLPCQYIQIPYVCIAQAHLHCFCYRLSQLCWKFQTVFAGYSPGRVLALPSHIPFLAEKHQSSYTKYHILVYHKNSHSSAYCGGRQLSYGRPHVKSRLFPCFWRLTWPGSRASCSRRGT